MRLHWILVKMSSLPVVERASCRLLQLMPRAHLTASPVNNILVVQQHFSEKYIEDLKQVWSSLHYAARARTHAHTETQTINVPMSRRSSFCPKVKEKTIPMKSVMQQPTTGSSNACSFVSLFISLPLQRRCVGPASISSTRNNQAGRINEKNLKRSTKHSCIN